MYLTFTLVSLEHWFFLGPFDIVGRRLLLFVLNLQTVFLLTVFAIFMCYQFVRNKDEKNSLLRLSGRTMTRKTTAMTENCFVHTMPWCDWLM